MKDRLSPVLITKGLVCVCEMSRAILLRFVRDSLIKLSLSHFSSLQADCVHVRYSRPNTVTTLSGKNYLSHYIAWRAGTLFLWAYYGPALAGGAQVDPIIKMSSFKGPEM